MATFDVAKLLNKITQDIPGINTVLKALAKWDVSALSDVPDGAMQATTDANNNLTINKKVSGSYTPVAKLMHDVDKLDGYHASTSATANAIPVRNASGALPGNILGNAVTADTATALATGSVVPVNQGGTGATTASQARANLGVADGADFTTHIATQASPSVEGHVKLDALAADGSNTAAPGGYGLGGFAAIALDLDTIVGTQLFRGAGGSLNKPVGLSVYGIHIQYSITSALQMVMTHEVVPRIFYRRLNTSIWDGWQPYASGITNSTDLASPTIAASATAVKAAYDRAQQVATDSISGGVKVGNAISSVSPDGTVTLRQASTSQRGDVQLSSSVTSGSAETAATSLAVKTAYDKAASSGTYAATSSTAAGTAAKDATCAGFSLSNQARVFVTFTNGNTVAGALTLNVNGTGAKAIYNERGATSASNFAVLPANIPIEFVYDGTVWRYKMCDIVNVVLQRVSYETGAYASTSATIPMDDTIPQATEGAQVMSAAITPKSASSKIVVDVRMFIAGNGSNHSMAALFKDSVSDAIESCLVTTSGSNYGQAIAMKKTLTLGDMATHTFSVRMGPYSGTMYLNGNSAGRLFGGTFISSITITEYAA